MVGFGQVRGALLGVKSSGLLEYRSHLPIRAFLVLQLSAGSLVAIIAAIFPLSSSAGGVVGSAAQGVPV